MGLKESIDFLQSKLLHGYDDDPLLLTICILEFWMVEERIHSADSPLLFKS